MLCQVVDVAIRCAPEANLAALLNDIKEEMQTFIALPRQLRYANFLSWWSFNWKIALRQSIRKSFPAERLCAETSHCFWLLSRVCVHFGEPWSMPVEGESHGNSKSLTRILKDVINSSAIWKQTFRLSLLFPLPLELILRRLGRKRLSKSGVGTSVSPGFPFRERVAS